MEIYKAIGYEFLIAFSSFLLKKLARKGRAAKKRQILPMVGQSFCI